MPIKIGQKGGTVIHFGFLTLLLIVIIVIAIALTIPETNPAATELLASMEQVKNSVAP